MLFLVHCGMAPLCIADDNAILFCCHCDIALLSKQYIELLYGRFLCVHCDLLPLCKQSKKGCIVMYAVWVNSCTV